MSLMVPSVMISSTVYFCLSCLWYSSMWYDVCATIRCCSKEVKSATHLQLAPAATETAWLIRGANSVGPEKYTAVTQSLYA